ncbi:MAG: octaprenyl diphosphate synthase [Chromatiales bacterium]|jgi:octaprenyl-diphosphate synthase
MEISQVRELVAADMQAVDKLIVSRLESDVVLINQIGHYIINSGGKRLRPMLVLIGARAMGYSGAQHIDIAAIIEFIHTATLLHDDVVDESDMRRSNETANAVWGNAASVLVGDFLYSRSFEMMVDVNSMRVMEVLAHATNRIAEGEVLQLLNCNDPDVTEQKYREVILRKTAVLFEAGTRLGAILCDADATTEQAMADYGLHLGIAFQMIDDALDYGSSDQDIGKNIGDDLMEGKPTLPLIRAMQQCDDTQRQTLRSVIENGNCDNIAAVQQIIQSTDAIEYTFKLARQEADAAIKALANLPDTPYKEALETLADFAVSRSL